MTNPLLNPSPLPYGLPAFDDIRLEHVVPAVREGIRRQCEEIEEILAASAPTWENTIEALERSGATLERATAWFFNLHGTDGSGEFDDVAEEIIPLLSAHNDWIYQNDDLYQRILAAEPPADEESQRLHRLIRVRFTRRGAELDAAGKKRLSEINQRLAVLSETFGRELQSDTRKLAVRVEDARELDGLEPARIDAARTLGEQSGRGGLVLALELPSVQSAQESLTDENTRRAVYEASLARGREANTPVLLESVRLRAERARLLGYDTHADFVIAEETAAQASAVRQLLEDLAPAASANAEAERKLAAELAGHEVSAADWPYYAARLRERDGGLNEAELRRYFPLDQVLRDGVFFAARRLYGITLSPRPDLRGYRDDVDVWEVFDASEAGGSGLGLLLTDYSARDTKRGGAWMSAFTEQAHLTGARPVVVNVMSIPMPADGSAPLLSLDEVTTVFHEFGHALHGLLSDVRYPSISGTNVPRDWVEFPSQINENWAFDPVVVANYARHVDTGEPLPAEYLRVVLEQRRQGQGFSTAEYLAASIIDLSWHSLSPEQASGVTDVAAFERRALDEAGLRVAELAPRYASTYFNHIFAGGYSAGYYSYLWAEALDADGFEWFTEQGGDDHSVRRSGQRFRELVLSRGAGSDYQEAFARLRGRGRSVDALLARRGLAGTATAQEQQ